MFDGIQSKIIAGLVIVLALGIGFHFWSVSDYVKTQASLEQKVTSLESDNDKLTESNASYIQTLKDKNAEEDSIRDMLAAAASIQAGSAKRVSELENEVLSLKRTKRIDAIVAAGGAEKLLVLENKDEACKSIHIGDASGSCKNGFWVLNGERYDEAVRRALSNGK